MSEFAATFDRDPEGYAAGRPGYPAELFAVLEMRCGLAEGTDVVEIGPGTGQATAELLRRGARVHAVEPGPGLARHLLAEHVGEPLEVTVSSFEDVVLPDAAADPIFEEFGDVESPAFVDTRQEEHWLPPLRETGFTDVAVDRFPWDVEQTSADLVALFSTFSNMRMRPLPEREQVLARIGAVAGDEFGGRVRRTYQAVLYTGRKPGG